MQQLPRALGCSPPMQPARMPLTVCSAAYTPRSHQGRGLRRRSYSRYAYSYSGSRLHNVVPSSGHMCLKRRTKWPRSFIQHIFCALLCRKYRSRVSSIRWLSFVITEWRVFLHPCILLQFAIAIQ